MQLFDHDDQRVLHLRTGARCTTCDSCAPPEHHSSTVISSPSGVPSIQHPTIPTIAACSCSKCGALRRQSQAHVEKPISVISLQPVFSWKTGLLQSWECDACATLVSPSLHDIAMTGLVCFHCTVDGNAVVDMSQTGNITCLEHETVMMLSQLRFGAHLTHTGFWTEISSCASYWPSTLDRSVSKRMMKSILRITTLYFKCIWSIRDDLEPPELASCYACSLVPSDGSCVDDGNPHALGGHSAIICDGGLYCQQRWFRKSSSTSDDPSKPNHADRTQSMSTGPCFGQPRPPPNQLEELLQEECISSCSHVVISESGSH